MAETRKAVFGISHCQSIEHSITSTQSNCLSFGYEGCLYLLFNIQSDIVIERAGAVIFCLPKTVKMTQNGHFARPVVGRSISRRGTGQESVPVSELHGSAIVHEIRIWTQNQTRSAIVEVPVDGYLCIREASVGNYLQDRQGFISCRKKAKYLLEVLVDILVTVPCFRTKPKSGRDRKHGMPGVRSFGKWKSSNVGRWEAVRAEEHEGEGVS
ncbi:hypothetical protein B0H19DRAFT_1077132 [Mycena capillaripes]|nr:hypothetical protein B0H19DRAFT_1077132 [Mycena capillaripes]